MTEFNPIPSYSMTPEVVVVDVVPGDVDAIGVPVTATGPIPAMLAIDRARLELHGFDGEPATTFVLPAASGPTLIAVGVGDSVDADVVRNAAAAFASAAGKFANLALHLDASSAPDDIVAEAAVEGVLLARYRYDALRSAPTAQPVASLTLVVPPDRAAAVAEGARRGRILAGATALSRDLANTPHSHLNAERFAEIAAELGPQRGVEVEIFDEPALRELQMAGVLAINQGSVAAPRMIKLTYQPVGDSGSKLALVGKGVMYDSGGLGIKPNDRIHAQMKNDMSGAAGIFAAMLALRELECPNTVTAYLMCTDNMPSGSAIALGDVITTRGGRTVEVMNTDAEGRVVMCDALVLAIDEGADAVVDMATLTGAALRALGTDIAAIFGNHSSLTGQVEAASADTGELVWELPLHRPYRKQLDSLTADFMNVGYGHGGAITAALYLAEFVGDTPWVHIDICGPSQVDVSEGWLPAGCSGFGARLIARLATTFEATWSS